MRHHSVDLELIARLRPLLAGRLAINADATPPQATQDGMLLRLLTRRITDVSQFQVESAVLHAAVSDRLATGQESALPSLLVIAAPVPLKHAGRRLLDLLAAAGCAGYRFIVLTPQGPHLVRLDAGPADEVADDQRHKKLVAPAQRGLSFAPAQSWVLRALLLGTVRDRPWWRGPRPAGNLWASASELASASGLAISTVTRTIQALEERSWVAKERSGLRLLDPAAMIQACADEAARRWSRRQSMRLSFSDAHGQAVVDAMWRMIREHDVVLPSCAETGWGALARDHLAVSTPDGRLPEIVLVGAGSPVLAACPMVPAPLRDAQLVVHLGALPADIPTGTKDQAPAVDPLLAMCHVAGDPQGGPEQVARLRDLVCEALG